MQATSRDRKQVWLGVIAGARGIRGDLWIKSFTAEPEAIAKYGPVFDESGERSFRLRITGSHNGRLIGRIEGIADRTAAEKLKGTRLYIWRDALPAADDDEFYHTDLIGMNVRLADDEDGAIVGQVTAVHDPGDNAILEIDGGSLGTIMVPFTHASVPDIDLTSHVLTLAALPVFAADSENAAEGAP